MKWTFTVKGKSHEAEWDRGAMRSSYSPVLVEVDRLIVEGYALPCGSYSHLVFPTLQTEAGAYATISAAVMLLADFESIDFPLTMATVTTDVIFPEV